MAHLLEIARGEKKKSTARRRAYFAGEFPETVQKSFQPLPEGVHGPVES